MCLFDSYIDLIVKFLYIMNIFEHIKREPATSCFSVKFTLSNLVIKPV